jgi:hypothetical protein
MHLMTDTTEEGPSAIRVAVVANRLKPPRGKYPKKAEQQPDLLESVLDADPAA